MQKAVEEKFKAEQDEFHTDVIDAFAESLHHIFLTAAGLMGVAVLLTLFVPNRKLKSGVKATPGE